MTPQKSSKRADLAVHTLVVDSPITLRVPAPTLIVTIESAVAELRVDSTRLVIDRGGCVVAATGDVAELSAAGAGSRIAAVSFHAPVFAEVERGYRHLGFDRRRFSTWLRKLAWLPRTVWVHELVHRYVFERFALGETDNLAIRFLEVEILKELYFLCRDRDAGEGRASIVRTHSKPVEEALRQIEANLYTNQSIASLARCAGASPSTLLRLFHAEVGCSPGAYRRNRRLDEALVALRGGRAVSEVATLVGYDNPTAFGFAFRRRFGSPPSAFRPKGRTRPAP